MPAKSTPKRKQTGTAAKYRSPAMTARRRLNFGPSNPAYTGRKGRVLSSRVGFPTSSVTDSRRITHNVWSSGAAAANLKQLNINEITNIPRKTSVEINGRERDVINCLGFTVRTTFENLFSNQSVCVRMAVVSPINSNTTTSTEFLRGYVNKRGESLVSLLDASQLLYNPINRDNHVVLWEKKFMVGPKIDDATTATESLFSRKENSYATFETYIRLNRQLRYDNASGDSCTDKLYLVMWCDHPNGTGVAAAPPGVRWRRFVVAHWKDPLV